MNKIKFIILGILLTFFIGCCPKITPTVIKKDSIVYKEKLVYKDTTIYKYLAGDTINKVDTVWINKWNGLVNSKKIYTFTSLAEASAWVYNSKLNLKLTQKDTTIEIRLDSAIKEATYWKEKYQNNNSVVIKEVTKSPWYMKALALFGGLCFIVIGLWIYNTKF